MSFHVIPMKLCLLWLKEATGRSSSSGESMAEKKQWPPVLYSLVETRIHSKLLRCPESRIAAWKYEETVAKLTSIDFPHTRTCISAMITSFCNSNRLRNTGLANCVEIEFPPNLHTAPWNMHCFSWCFFRFLGHSTANICGDKMDYWQQATDGNDQVLANDPSMTPHNALREAISVPTGKHNYCKEHFINRDHVAD